MADLETTLSLLATHGRPKLFQMDGGTWYCCVDMHVAAKGAAFKVASEFNCPCALSAADQCLDRIYTMLGSFGADAVRAITHG